MNLSITQADIDKLWNFLSPSSPAIKSDVIFVFGGVDLKVPQQAVKLYERHYSSKILVSGGSGIMTSKYFVEPEAEVFADEMIKNGVPKDVIILETEASNTGENISFGMEKLQNEKLHPKSALLVSKPFIMQRALLTFQKQYPDVIVTPCPPSGRANDYIDRELPTFVRRLAEEVRRLQQYPQLGYITQIDVPEDICRITDYILNL